MRQTQVGDSLSEIEDEVENFETVRQTQMPSSSDNVVPRHWISIIVILNRMLETRKPSLLESRIFSYNHRCILKGR